MVKVHGSIDITTVSHKILAWSETVYKSYMEPSAWFKKKHSAGLNGM